MPTTASIRALVDGGRHQEAIDACVAEIERCGDPEFIYLLAVACERTGRLPQALTLFEEAVRHFPKRAEVAFNYGVALVRIGHIDRAAAEWRRVLQLDGCHEGALFNLARTAARQEATDDAERLYRRLLSASPRHVGALYNLGNLLVRGGRLTEAEALFRTVLEDAPEHADAWANLSLCLLRAGHTEAAVEAGRKAVEVAPDRPPSHVNLAHALLKSRRLKEGLAEFEWRRKVQTIPFVAPADAAWRSGPLRGRRLIVFSEQGHGDAIQFLRYVAAAAELGNEITLVVHPALARLAAHVDGIARVLPFGKPLPPFDAYAPLMSLPFLTGRHDIADIPPTPYLVLPEITPMPVRPPLRVGLVWRGNPDYSDDGARSCALADLMHLVANPDVRWYSLQLGGGGEITGTGLSGLVEDALCDATDFLDTARIIQTLDFVIGVDTAVVHLAGALGVPAWLMLPFVSDWRWFDDVETTPWYPLTRLFRQSEPGRWDGVVTRMASELATAVRMR